jgi:hypothetical protein
MALLMAGQHLPAMSLSMNNCERTPGRSPSILRKWLFRIGVFLAVLFGLEWGAVTAFRYAAARRLREAMAEVDCVDPGWRFEELEARRAAVADEDNAALCVLAVQERLPTTWPHRDVEEALSFHPPAAQFNESQILLLRRHLDALQPALAEARKLSRYATGRYALEQGDVQNPTQPSRVYDVSDLLRYDALLLAQDNDMAGAMRSCRAIAMTGRSVGDAPIPFLQVLRQVHIVRSLFTVEWTLSQGEATEADLLSLQQLFEDEAEHPGCSITLRGYRAIQHRLLESIEAGQVTVKQVTEPRGERSRWDHLLAAFQRDAVKFDHAQFLEAATEHNRLAQLPFEELPRPFAPAARIRGFGSVLLAQRLSNSFDGTVRDFQRSHACLRCGIVLLAAERYRLAEQRWPTSVGELVPRFLSKPVLDPYDCQPIRLQPMGDNLVIYSVGPDGVDDGGAIWQTPSGGPGSDLGFRLWDVDKRRQPAPPPRLLDHTEPWPAPN